VNSVFHSHKCYLLSGVICLFGCWLLNAPSLGHAQEITFEFQIEYDGLSSQAMRFGLREDALPGLDDHDVPEPPNLPDATFAAFLAMASPPAEIPNHWRYDLRPSLSLMADRIELWQFAFQAIAVGGEATITIDTVGEVPVPYDLYFIGSGIVYEPLLLPHSFDITVDSGEMIFFWELQLSDAVVADGTTWGGVKSLYR